ncbi:MAG: deoxyguanosinetriphosphate triphosphohydrolase [Desulfuromonadaceae bacterium]|nr:deoxyguanosinetriphosphate triphosphohydrolase [Desulfuromonadaceae bacterium]
MTNRFFIRLTLEEDERQVLSPYACLSSQSKGRERTEQPCPLRTCFQHDRDRILHCKSFRRLKHKTQVFLSPEGDHYRTRLTHTLEVSQIARTISRSLRLNEDLTEAISLGHDLGHTPFGHAGERVLDQLLPQGFHHCRQSLRVVDVLEKDGRGLNLTHEVRDGILRHSKGRGPVRMLPGSRGSLEGQAVRLADIIAYVNHDLDDALRAGVVSRDQVPQDLLEVLGQSHSQRINCLIHDCLFASEISATGEIRLSDPLLAAITDLRDWLFQHVYQVASVHDDFAKAERLISELFAYFMSRPEIMPHYGAAPLSDESLETQVADFIAGMSDRYALRLYEELFLPRPWRSLVL